MPEIFKPITLSFAVVKYGEYITAMSGSVGGTTHARNRYGFYVRNRTKPVNPNTDRQNAIRAALASLTQRWSQILTADQRTAWNLYGNSVVMKNALGEDIFLTGFNHFIRSNSFPVVVGGLGNDPGPVIFELPVKDPTFAISASAGTQTISYTFDGNMTWVSETNATLIKYMGSPQNAQRNFFAGPWRYHGVVVGDIVSPPSSPDDQIDPPFAFAAGQRIWCYARIRRADGRLSEPFQTSVLAGA